jgi:hypothetical protein
LGTTLNYIKKVRRLHQKEISKKIRKEIEKERLNIKLKELEKHFKAYKNYKVREENIINALKTVIPTFPVPEKIKYNNTDIKNGSNRVKTTPILLVSDWHIGEYVNINETLGLGHFNAKIAAARVEQIAEKTIHILLKQELIDVEKLVVVALGDMVSGIIHEELEKTEDLNAAEQVYYASYLLAILLDDLSRYFKKIEFYGVIGNHGRIKQRRYYKEKYVNYDYLVYQITSLLLKDNPYIEFNIPKSPHMIVSIYNHNFLFTHGDAIRSWAGIPWYGITRYTNSMRELTNYQQIILNGVCMGHFHQPAYLDRINGPIIINGSLKGIDEFSLSYGLGAKPSQTLFGVTEKYPITFKYILWLDEKDEPERYKPVIPDVWADFKNI